MEKYISKSALVAWIKSRLLPTINSNADEFERGEDNERIQTLNFIHNLEVKEINSIVNPYDAYIQYTDRKSAIKAHAEDYSFNIESELFNQLTKEQQALWRKEIEQACISGGYSGLNLAIDNRYKQEEPVSEELENTAIQYAGKHAPYDDAMDEVEEAFKAGAKWQEKQDQSIIELAEDHAVFAGMEKMKEQMMAKAVEAKVTARWPLHSSPLYYSYEIYVPYAQHLSEGDKVKILIIKQEDD